MLPLLFQRRCRHEGLDLMGQSKEEKGEGGGEGKEERERKERLKIFREGRGAGEDEKQVKNMVSLKCVREEGEESYKQTSLVLTGKKKGGMAYPRTGCH